MAVKQVTFRVFRFNASTDYRPAYTTHIVDAKKHDVVLDILNKIKWELDPAFAFRSSCRHGICGTCGIKVNGKPILSCKQNVHELIEKYGNELIIEPQSISRAIKDLIIDKSDYWSKDDSVIPYLIADVDEAPESENIVSPDDAARIDNADYCIQCGSCYYVCQTLTVNETFLGPAALAKAYRFTSDVRDNAKVDRLKVVNEPLSGIWDCVKCYACSEACPKDIDPMGKITRLHNQSFNAGVVKDGVASRHSTGFVDSMNQNGFLNPNELVRFSEGSFGAMKHFSEAYDMFSHDKLPFSVPTSKNLDEVKTIIKSIEDDSNE